MKPKEEMELACRIFRAIEEQSEGSGWNAEMIEGQEFSDPDKIVYRIYHSDGYCMEVCAEKQIDVESGDDPKDYAEMMLPDGWTYSVQETYFDGFKEATIEQVAEWAGVQITA